VRNPTPASLHLLRAYVTISLGDRPPGKVAETGLFMLKCGFPRLDFDFQTVSYLTSSRHRQETKSEWQEVRRVDKPAGRRRNFNDRPASGFEPLKRL
jgi:hypothetical protein